MSTINLAELEKAAKPSGVEFANELADKVLQSVHGMPYMDAPQELAILGLIEQRIAEYREANRQIAERAGAEPATD